MQYLDALVAVWSLVSKFVAGVRRAGGYGAKDVVFEKAVDETGACESGSYIP